MCLSYRGVHRTIAQNFRISVIKTIRLFQFPFLRAPFFHFSIQALYHIQTVPATCLKRGASYQCQCLDIDDMTSPNKFGKVT